MSFKSFSNKSPSIDGGMGLIIRLNILFNKADRSALAGDLDEWNCILDRVFVNLGYREPLDIQIDKVTGKVIKLQLSSDDEIIYKEFWNKIKQIKREKLTAIINKNRLCLEQAKQKHYDVLMMKDMWLRKLMNEMGLYLKEVDFNPATALFGG